MEEKEFKTINVLEIVKTLWSHRKEYYIPLSATLVIAYLFMASFPRYYQCTVCLAPENTTMPASMNTLASSFGLDRSLTKLGNNDAISSYIYPKVIKSKNFAADLLTVQVTSQDSAINCNYYTYLRDHQKSPWWSSAMEAVMDLFGSKSEDEYNGNKSISTFNLTKRQNALFTAAQNSIACEVDRSNDLIFITATAQDPRICAILADSTCLKLQEFIINYRTNKARIDFNYYEELCKKGKADYNKASRLYAEYVDSHSRIALQVSSGKKDELQNEMQLKHNIYNAIETQKQIAAAKLQEATPAFTVIESASIPMKPAGPKRMYFAIAMTILAFIVRSLIILIKEKQLLIK
jgi:hypothetical protein